MKRFLIAALFLVAAGFAPHALAQSDAQPPLDRTEILGRLAIGYSPSYVAYLVRNRGVNFSVSATFLDQVGRAGGRGVLLDELPHAVSPNGGAAPNNIGDPPADHLAKCAELLHIADFEDAKAECRASITENPASPWPFHASMWDLEWQSQETDRRQPDLAMQKEIVDLGREAAARTPAPSAPAPIRERRGFSWSDSALSPDAMDGEEFGQLSTARNELEMFGYAMPDDMETPPSDQRPDVYQGILEQLLQAVQSEPNLAGSHFKLASFYHLQLNDFDNARAEYLEAIRLEPDAERNYVWLAVMYRSQKDFNNVVAELRELTRIAPQGTVEHLALAHGLREAGRDADAIEEFRAILARRPAQRDASNSLVDMYVQQKDLKSAIEELRRWLKVSAASYSDESKFVEEHWYDEKQLAGLLEDSRDLEGAGDLYQYLIRFKPDDASVHNDYGNVLMDLRRCDQAIGEYNQAIRLDASMPEPHHNTALCLAKNKDLDGAINEFRAALQLDPKSSHTQSYLGMALIQKGDTQGGEREFRDLIETNPKDPEPHLEFALALATMKRDADAIPELKKALELNPDLPAAENNLAWIYATSSDQKLRNPGEALRLAQQAVKTSPTPNPAFIDTLAEAQLLNGDAVGALATEEKALAVDPDNPELKTRVDHFRVAAGKSPHQPVAALAQQ